MLKYAGIGSRQTPPDMLAAMESIGEQLGDRWLLRSGYARGADMAFGRGAEEAGNFEMFLPWHGYNDAPTDDPRFIVPELTQKLWDLAAAHHPMWYAKRRDGTDVISPAAKKMHMRNGCQILGRDLDDPVDMVICWTPNGSGAGGTGQALRIAQSYHIPIFDLAIEASRHAVCEFTWMAEQKITIRI